MDSAWRSGGPAVVVWSNAFQARMQEREWSPHACFCREKIVSKFEGHVDVLTVGKMTTGREME